MRRTLDPELLREALRALGRRARGPGRVYVTGGSSALLFMLIEHARLMEHFDTIAAALPS